MQTAALDSARSLPRGKKVALAAAGADVQGRARHLYDLPSSERWDDPPPPEKREWQQYRVIPKIAYAFRLGLGAGAQIDVIGFNAVGIGVGLKWQLIGGQDGLFALALGGRATASAFGEGETGDSGRIAELAAQAMVHLSLHPTPRVDLYAAPTLLAERLSHTITREDIDASTVVTARAVGSGAGAVAWISPAVGLVVEVTALRFTAEDERRSWLTTAMLGWLQRL